MTEYIEREKLPPKKERGFFLDDDFNAGWNACLNKVNSIPAADVVEVVRCKDCFNRTKSGMCIQWSRYEKIVNTPDYAFCSWGVKENG